MHAEKVHAIFLSKCFKKWLKTPFIACFFFKKSACGAESWAKTGSFSALRELGTEFSQPKKLDETFTTVT